MFGLVSSMTAFLVARRRSNGMAGVSVLMMQDTGQRAAPSVTPNENNELPEATERSSRIPAIGGDAYVTPVT